MSERWDDAETQAWQQARAARLREAVARLEGRNMPENVREGTQDARTGPEGTRAGSDASERLTRAHRRSVLSHDPPDAPNADEHPPHPVVDPPAAGDVWWRKRARYGR